MRKRTDSDGPAARAAANRTRSDSAAILPGAVYPLQVFTQITGFKGAAMRAARRSGLLVRYTGNRAFVLADDFIEYLRAEGKSSAVAPARPDASAQRTVTPPSGTAEHEPTAHRPAQNDRTDLPVMPALLSAKSLARLLDITLARLQQMNSTGRLPKPIRLSSGCLRWNRLEVERWIEAGCPTRSEQNTPSKQDLVSDRPQA